MTTNEKNDSNKSDSTSADKGTPGCTSCGGNTTVNARKALGDAICCYCANAYWLADMAGVKRGESFCSMQCIWAHYD